MEIKFELDMEKVAKATVAIAASYELGQVSKGTEYAQLAFANGIALIAIIVILYSPRPTLKAKWPADTRLRDTKTMQQALTQWAVVKRTRDGASAPDGVRVPI